MLLDIFQKVLLHTLIKGCFTPDADYLCSARSVYEQYHLRSSINVSMHKIRPDTLMTVKNNLKGTIERSVADGNICAHLCV